MRTHSKSIAWILTWALMHSITMSLVKVVGKEVNIFMMVFVRSSAGVIFLLPLMKRTGWRSSLITHNLKMQIVRAIFLCGALAMTYYTYRHLSLPLATSIGFTQPLILTILAILFLKEYITWDRWVALIFGYVGVLFFVNPFHAAFDPDIWAALLANLFASAVIISTKILTRTDHTVTILLYSFITVIFLSGWVVIYDWQPLPLEEISLLLLIGAVGTFSQYCYISALKFGTASLVAPFEYTRLVFAVPIGYIFFGEAITYPILLGTLIIIIANIYIAKKSEARARSST